MNTFLRSISLLIVMFATSFLFGGCAFGTRTINLNYTLVGTNTINGSPKIAIAKFVDTREDKLVVGEVRNGYGMKTAKVVLQEPDAGGWVANALADELKSAGFEVIKTENPTTTGAVASISGNISKLYTATFMTYQTSTKIRIVVTKASIPVLNKEYDGQGSAVAIALGASGFEKVSKEALQSVMKQAIPEIIEALK